MVLVVLRSASSSGIKSSRMYASIRSSLSSGTMNLLASVGGDGVPGGLTAQEAPGLGRGLAAQLHRALLRVPGDVRGEEHRRQLAAAIGVVERMADGWLVRQHVEGRCSQVAGPQCRKQGTLVDDGAPGRVDKNGMRRQQRQRLGIDQVARLLAEQAMEAESIGAYQQVVQALHTGGARHLVLAARHVRIIPAHVKAEGLRAAGYRLPDAPEAEQGQ